MNELKQLGLEVNKLSLCLGNVINHEQQFNIMYNDEIIGYGHMNLLTNWAHCNLTLNQDNRNLHTEAEAEYALELLVEQEKINTYNF